MLSLHASGFRSAFGDVYELHQNPPSCGHIINPQISTKRMTDLQKWSWRKVGCFHKCWTGSQNLGHHLSLFKVGCHSTGNSPAVYAEQHGYNFYSRTPTNHSTYIPPCSLPKWNLPYASQILGVGSISALNTQFISILFPSSEYRWHRQVKKKQNSKGEWLLQQPPFHQICHCSKCSRGTRIDCGSYLNAAPAQAQQLLLQIDAMEKCLEDLQDKRDGKVHCFAPWTRDVFSKWIAGKQHLQIDHWKSECSRLYFTLRASRSFQLLTFRR